MRFVHSLASLSLASLSLAGDFQTCEADVPLSCHNETAVADTCCFIPAGQLLLTQFWDTEPVTGPSDSWTIHGLWPDNCDGTYPSNCDNSRAYTNISAIVASHGSNATLSFMSKYWKDYKGDDESFWEHEWSKHGTCVSTLEPSCYENYDPTEEAADYFDTTVELFKALPTYEWLADADILPSESKTYRLDAVQAALQEQHGAEVTLGCKGQRLNEVWYHYNVKGSLQEGEFVAAEPDGTKGSCPQDVRYEVKSGQPSRSARRWNGLREPSGKRVLNRLRL